MQGYVVPFLPPESLWTTHGPSGLDWILEARRMPFPPAGFAGPAEVTVVDLCPVSSQACSLVFEISSLFPGDVCI